MQKQAKLACWTLFHFDKTARNFGHCVGRVEEKGADKGLKWRPLAFMAPIVAIIMQQSHYYCHHHTTMIIITIIINIIIIIYGADTLSYNTPSIVSITQF